MCNNNDLEGHRPEKSKIKVVSKGPQCISMSHLYIPYWKMFHSLLIYSIHNFVCFLFFLCHSGHFWNSVVRHSDNHLRFSGWWEIRTFSLYWKQVVVEQSLSRACKTDKVESVDLSCMYFLTEYTVFRMGMWKYCLNKHF